MPRRLIDLTPWLVAAPPALFVLAHGCICALAHCPLRSCDDAESAIGQPGAVLYLVALLCSVVSIGVWPAVRMHVQSARFGPEMLFLVGLAGCCLSIGYDPGGCWEWVEDD